MRLLNTTSLTFAFAEFYESDIPPYGMQFYPIGRNQTKLLVRIIGFCQWLESGQSRLDEDEEVLLTMFDSVV